MPHVGVTVYDLLLSCPGDVLDLKETIDACVKSFNSSIGEANNIRVDLKHWSTDSYTQSGDKPQNILNRQFVLDCDLCIALLGIRFGTPTDNYDSGTEEEIEKMLEQGKQVFLYFVERNVDPSKIDLEQYKKVKDFREKYSDKGVYTVVKSAEDLRSDFQNALSLYFIKLVAPNTAQFQPSLAPKLIISSTNDKKTSITPFHTDYQNVRYVEDKEIAIKELIAKISSTEITPSMEESLEEPECEIPDGEWQEKPYADVLDAVESKIISKTQYYRLLGTKPPQISKVEVDNTQKHLISTFCENQKIELSKDFFDLGNLQREKNNSVFSGFGQSNIKYLGSESEQEKNQLFEELVVKLHEYNDMMGFFGKIDAMPCISLQIENKGNTYDEDIDVKIFVEKGCIADIEHIPEPGLCFLEEMVDAEAPKALFSGKGHADIDDFSNYPVTPYIPQLPSLPFKSITEEFEEQRKKYREMLETVFCYNLKENKTDDILCFNVPYLKQNTKMFFPSYLFFVKTPSSFKYEIRAKRSPEIYSETLAIENEGKA